MSPLPERTGICGWSMGGYGAIRFAEAFPDQIRAVASGIGLLDYPSKDLPVKEFGVADCFGKDTALWPSFNCMTNAEKLRGIDILVIAAKEAWDYQMNLNFHARLEKLGIKHDYREISGGHTFQSVQESLPQWFEFMNNHLNLQIEERIR